MHSNWSSQRVISVYVCARARSPAMPSKVNTHSSSAPIDYNGKRKRGREILAIARAGHQSQQDNGSVCTLYLPATPHRVILVMGYRSCDFHAFTTIVREHRWGTHRFFGSFSRCPFVVCPFSCFHLSEKFNCKCKRCCVISSLCVYSIFFCITLYFNEMIVCVVHCVRPGTLFPPWVCRAHIESYSTIGDRFQ